jgi:hypothetical protein
MKLKYIFYSVSLALVLSVIVCQSANSQSADWRPLGPIRTPDNIEDNPGGVGRASQIKFHPTDPKTLYCVTSRGGLFISKDDGYTWRSLTDQLPATQTGAVCIDHTDDRIIYFGTGDPHYYGAASMGMWKTIDEGRTWTSISGGVSNRTIVELLMSPLDHNVLIAATNDGIWKTTDGGATWNVKKSGGDFQNMVFKPSQNSSTLYACTSTEFWYSINMGETWTKTNLPGTGLVKGGRIAVSKADPSIVYLTFVGDFDAVPKTSTPVLRSTDSGVSFSVVRPAGLPNMNGYSGTSRGQENFNYGIGADPKNANIVYIVAHFVYRSTDGGVTWQLTTNEYRSPMHTDMHYLVWSPHDDRKLYCANDGGIWVTYDGFVWIDLNNGLASNEVNGSAQSPLDKNVFVAGSQDNGASFYYYAPENEWYHFRGGDVNSKMAFDYNSSNYVYYLNGSRQNLRDYGSVNLNFPFTPDNNGNNTVLEFTPLQKAVAFLGKNDVYRSDNVNSGSPTWKKITNVNTQIKAIGISPVDANVVYVVTNIGTLMRSDNALDVTPTWNTYSTPITATNRAGIAVIKSNPDIVYMACNSRMYRSPDKGVNWTDISGTNLPDVGGVIRVIHDIHSTNESVYIASTVNAVYYKNSNMSQWMNYSKGLPTVANISNITIYNDGSPNSVLRVATTGRGVWQSGLYNQLPVLRTSDNPSGTMAGLSYEYFEGEWIHIPNFNSLSPAETGNTTDFNLTNKNRDTNFGFRFKGYLKVASDGAYTFYLDSDDGSILYIGDQVVVDRDSPTDGAGEKSGTIGLKAGFHAITVDYINKASGDKLNVSYAGPSIVKQIIPASALVRMPLPVSCSGTGAMNWEFWANVAGNDPQSIPLQNNPTRSGLVYELRDGDFQGENFGTRFRGYLCPPYTGNYTFWIAGDDGSELWLSTDETPENKKKIASFTGATPCLDFSRFTTQKSAQVSLVAGQKYYIEALHKEGAGADFMAVRWKLPSGEVETPIPGMRLMPFQNLVTAVDDEEASADVSELANYPNPFHYSTTITFTLKEPGYTSLAIYDAMGHKVDVPEKGKFFSAGKHSLIFDPAHLPAGIYILKVLHKGRAMTSLMCKQ